MGAETDIPSTFLTGGQPTMERTDWYKQRFRDGSLLAARGRPAGDASP